MLVKGIVSEDNRWNTALCSRTKPRSFPTETSLTGQPGVNVYLSIQVPTCSPSVLVDSLIGQESVSNHKQRHLSVNPATKQKYSNGKLTHEQTWQARVVSTTLHQLWFVRHSEGSRRQPAGRKDWSTCLMCFLRTG
jgi:hypothetical protein